MKPHVNVRDFGAKGDNTTDDTTAIQAAINVAKTLQKSPEVFFPPGNYVISSALTIGDGLTAFCVSLVGPKVGPTTDAPPAQLKPSSLSMNAIVVRPSPSLTAFFGMENIGIKYPAGSATGTALDIANLTAGVIEGVVIQGAGYGVKLDTTVGTKFRDCEFAVCDVAGVQAVTTNLLQFDDCWFQANAIGFKAAAGGNNSVTKFTGCVFESSTTAEIQVAGALSQFSFDTCWWEFVAPNGCIEVTGSVAGWSMANGTFNNCIFQIDASHIINITGASHTSEYVQNVGFYDCYHVGTGGKITNATAGEPNNNGFGFKNLTVLGGGMNGVYQGIIPMDQDATQHSVFHGVNPSNINPTLGALGPVAYTADYGGATTSVGPLYPLKVLRGKADDVAIGLGRTATEASLAIATAGGHWVTGAAAGDVILRNESSSNAVFLGIGGEPGLKVTAPADGNTALLLRRNVGGTLTLQQVSMGATDSGGSGFKVLRVPN